MNSTCLVSTFRKPSTRAPLPSWLSAASSPLVVTFPSVPTNFTQPLPGYSSFSQLLSCINFVAQRKVMAKGMAPTVKSLRSSTIVPSSRQEKLNLVGQPLSNSVLSTPLIVARVERISFALSIYSCAGGSLVSESSLSHELNPITVAIRRLNKKYNFFILLI